MRKCDECTACCTLLPVKELSKKAGDPCPHLSDFGGCHIYEKRPKSCRLWSCRWLTGDDTADIQRPDQSHYVIDITPDFITIVENSGDPVPVRVEQIWVDPKFPDAHTDPALRAYLTRRGEEGIAALIRYDSTDGFVLFPPSMTGGAGFVEHRGGQVRAERTAEELFELLQQRGDI